MRVLAVLRERRLLQFLGAYAITGFVALEGVDQLVDHAILPELAYTLTLVFYLAGVPATLIFAWFHGQKGPQKMPRAEIWLLSGVLLLALVVNAAVVRNYLTARARNLEAADLGLDPRRIAVLYFNDLSKSQELAYLADGFTEALIDQLARVQGLDVISKNGVALYRQADIPRDSVARALGVGTLIEGSLEESGDRLRVNVRLVDGASGADFKRQSLEWPAGDLLAMRDELAEEVTRFLREWLGEEIRLRKRREGTENVGAWALVQRAERARKDAMALLEEDEMAGAFGAFQRADSLLAQAEALDTAWAEPTVLRGQIAYRRSRLAHNPLEADKAVQVGMRHVERALQLEPNNPDAFELRGTMRYWRWLLALEPDPAAADQLLHDAEEDLREATRLEPRQANAWNVLAHLYVQKDDDVEANHSARQAYEADAYLRVADQILWRLYTTSYDLEVHPQAIHWCDEGRRRFPTHPRFVECQLWLMTSKAKDPDVDAAWRLAEQVVELTPEREREVKRLRMHVAAAAVLARAGLADSARHVLERSRGNPEIDPLRELLATQAFVRTLLEDRDEAVRLLSEYLTANPERREGFATHGHWWWRSLQDDPRFKQLAGLPK